MYEAGLINASIAGYLPSHIKIVAGFDVSTTKINKPLSQAIYAEPNICQPIIPKDQMPKSEGLCYPGPQSDGCYRSYDESGNLIYDTYAYFRAYDESKVKPVDVAQVLKETKTEILINLLPVGSYEASRRQKKFRE